MGLDFRISIVLSFGWILMIVKELNVCRGDVEYRFLILILELLIYTEKY